MVAQAAVEKDVVTDHLTSLLVVGVLLPLSLIILPSAEQQPEQSDRRKYSQKSTCNPIAITTTKLLLRDCYR